MAFFLWSATTAQEFRQEQNRGLAKNINYGTENEFEFAPPVIELVKAKSEGKNLHVGDFKLDAGEGFALSSCSLIEGQFRYPTACTCSISMLHSSAVNFGCQPQDVSCNEWQVCSRPVYTGTVSLESPVMTSNFCLKDLHILGEERRFGDLCVLVEHGRGEAVNLKKCRAQIGAKKCDCNICNDGAGIRLDCSGVDQSLVSTQCDDISLILGIQGASDSIDEFLPSFLYE